MKSFVEEIEDFQADVQRDIGLDESSISNQAILNALQDWDHVQKIRDRSRDGLEILRESIRKIDSGSLENERGNLIRKVMRLFHQR